MKLTADLLIRNTSRVLTLAGAQGPRCGVSMSDLSPVDHGVVAAHQGETVWVGLEADLAAHVHLTPDCRVIDASGGAVLPGWVDPHTHLVFAGTREDEFCQKIAGVPYMEIAARGGGIKRTMRSTRAAAEDDLTVLGRDRIRDALRFGITAIEIKSGYGLEPETEYKILRVARRLEEEFPVEIVRTFLGAHEVPPGTGKPEYLDQVIRTMIPDVARDNLAEFCDVFCERGVFTPEEAFRVLDAGKQHGLRPKIHADQMTCGRGVHVAAELGAVSADHLDHTDRAGMAAMKSAGTIPVLLPGAVFFLGLKTYAAARDMIEMGLPVALATDFNPGSCMSLNMSLILTIACIQMRMTIPEAITAVTVNAAHAIGRGHRCGTIEPGKRADYIVLDCASEEMIPYHMGHNHVRHVICRGLWMVRDGKDAEIV